MVSWIENVSKQNSDGDRENNTVRYYAEEQYFKNNINLVGGGGRQKKIIHLMSTMQINHH